MALTDVWLSPAVVLVVIGITMASAMPVFSGASSPPTPLMLVINESIRRRRFLLGKGMETVS